MKNIVMKKTFIDLLEEELRGNYTDMVFQMYPEERSETHLCQLKRNNIAQNFKMLSMREAFRQSMDEVTHPCTICNISPIYNKVHSCPVAIFELSSHVNSDSFPWLNPQFSIELKRKAAIMDYLKAKVSLAESYFTGKYDSSDEWKGLELMGEVAIHSGFEIETHKLIDLLSKSACIPEKYQIPFIARLANSGNKEMMYRLVEYHIRQNPSSEIDLSQINHYIKKIIESKDASEDSIKILDLVLPVYEMQKKWHKSLQICEALYDITGEEKYWKRIKELELTLLGISHLTPKQVTERGFQFLYGTNVEFNPKLAQKCFDYGIEHNVPKAHRGMALCHLGGIGLDYCRTKALSEFRVAWYGDRDNGDLASWLWCLNHHEEYEFNSNELNNLKEEFLQQVNHRVTLGDPESLLIKGRLMITGELDLCDKNLSQAVSNLKYAWENGIIEAAYWLSLCDTDNSYAWLRKGVEKNEPESLYQMGMNCSQTNVAHKNRFYKESAIRGHHKAKYRIAISNRENLSQQERETLLLPAAYEGIETAVLPLINLYWDQSNFRQVAYWGEKCMNHNLKGLVFKVAYSHAHEGNKLRAKELYLILAEQNNEAALNNLGCIEDDSKISAQYFRKSAELGDDVGAYNYARYLFYGIGIEKNSDLALTYYKQSANKGYFNSKLSLARIYSNGDNVPQDFSQAKYWFEEALKQDRIKTTCPYARFLIFKDGESENLKRAKEILEDHISTDYRKQFLSSETKKAYGETCYLLGATLETSGNSGLGNKDSIYWYRQAARLSNSEAIERLKSLNINWISETGEVVDK